MIWGERTGARTDKALGWIGQGSGLKIINPAAGARVVYAA